MKISYTDLQNTVIVYRFSISLITEPISVGIVLIFLITPKNLLHLNKFQPISYTSHINRFLIYQELVLLTTSSRVLNILNKKCIHCATLVFNILTSIIIKQHQSVLH